MILKLEWVTYKMKILKRLKNLFKQELLPDQTSNINGIGVGRVVDIKRIIKHIESVKNEIKENTQKIDQVDNKVDQVDNKVSQVDNKVDQLTTKVNQNTNDIERIDVDNLAKKNVNNNFSVNQTIKTNTPFIEFRDLENDRYGYVGNETISNENLVIKAERGDLELKAKNKVKVDQTPVNNVDVVNKKYVDDQIANITPPEVDLSNFAKLSGENNLFTNVQNFNSTANFNSTINMSFLPVVQRNNQAVLPEGDWQLTPKKYVDDQVNPLKQKTTNTWVSHRVSSRVSITKYGWGGNFRYEWSTQVPITNYQNYLVVVVTRELHSGNSDRVANYRNSFTINEVTIQNSSSSLMTVYGSLYSSVDLNVGGSSHTGQCVGWVYMVKVY